MASLGKVQGNATDNGVPVSVGFYTYDDSVNDPNADCPQHGHDQVNGDRHVDGNSVPLFQALAGEKVCKLTHFFKQISIRYAARFVFLVAFPRNIQNQSSQFAVSGLNLSRRTSSKPPSRRDLFQCADRGRCS